MDYADITCCDKCGWQWDKDRNCWEAHPWMKVPCPIPPPGVKKKDYVVQTLGQLMRVDPDRAYGFWMNYHEAKPWKGSKGEDMAPSKESVAFAAACKAQFDHVQSEKGKKYGDEDEEEEDGPPF